MDVLATKPPVCQGCHRCPQVHHTTGTAAPHHSAGAVTAAAPGPQQEQRGHTSSAPVTQLVAQQPWASSCWSKECSGGQNAGSGPFVPAGMVAAGSEV